MIKVLHVNDIASVGSSLVAGLKNAGVECDMVDMRKPLAGFPLWLKLLGAGTRFVQARRIVRFAHDNGYQALHIHYLSSTIWFIGSGLPIVVHAHGSDVRLSRWSLVRHFVNWLSCRMARLVLYSTPDLDRYMRRYTSRARFLPNPIQPEIFATRPGPGNPKKIFLFAALTKIKGAERAIEALKNVKKRFPDVEISSFDLGAFQSQARLAGIKLLKPLPRAEIPTVLQDAGLILGQFRVGAIGMSELEVLAMGRTVICHFEYAQIYPEKPPFVQAHYVDEIERAVVSYLENPDIYNSQNQRARAWVAKNHGLELVTNTLLGLYADFLGPHPKPAGQSLPVMEAKKSALFLSLHGLGNSIINYPILRVLERHGWNIYVAAFRNGSSKFFQDLSVSTIALTEKRELAVKLRRERYRAVVAPFPAWKRELFALASTTSKARYYSFAKPYEAFNVFARYPRAGSGLHDIEQNVILLKTMGVEVQVEDLYITAPQVPAKGQLRKVVLHPTASTPIKYYPLEFWRQLVTQLGTVYDEVEIFTGPDPNEGAFCHSILEGMDESRFKYFSNLNFNTLIQKFAEAEAFVGSDSALMHIAALMDRKVVGLWSFADFHRIYPYGNLSHIYLPREVLKATDYEYPKTPLPYLQRARAGEILDILAGRRVADMSLKPLYKKSVSIHIF